MLDETAKAIAALPKHMTLPKPVTKSNESYSVPVVESDKMTAIKKQLVKDNTPKPDPDTITLKYPTGDVTTITGWRNKPESEYPLFIANRAQRGYTYWLSVNTKDGKYETVPALIEADRIAELRAIYMVCPEYDVTKHKFKPFRM